MSKFVPIVYRSANGYDPDAVSRENGLACEEGSSMADQSFAEECDINTIVRRFGLTGELPNDLEMPQSGDFTNVKDFHSAMNIVRKAEEEFLRVPAHVRAEFANDPGRFMAFFEDPKNRDRAIELGLVVPPAPEAPPVRVEVISPPQDK